MTPQQANDWSLIDGRRVRKVISIPAPDDETPGGLIVELEPEPDGVLLALRIITTIVSIYGIGFLTAYLIT